MSLPQLPQPVLKRTTSAPSASTPMERSVAPVAQRTVSTLSLGDALARSATDYESETPPTILLRADWSRAQKRRFKLIKALLERDTISIVIFGSTVRMMMGMCPFRETSDVDCMASHGETATVLRLLRKYGETVVTTTPGSASYTGTRCKVTTATFRFGKFGEGTVLEDEFVGDFTEISFDIVEIPRTTKTTYAETVKKMNCHVQPWIAIGATGDPSDEGVEVHDPSRVQGPVPSRRTGRASAVLLQAPPACHPSRRPMHNVPRGVPSRRQGDASVVWMSQRSRRTCQVFHAVAYQAIERYSCRTQGQWLTRSS